MKFFLNNYFLLSIFIVTSCQSSITNPNENLKEDKVSPQLRVDLNINIETLALIYNLSESGDYLFSNNPFPKAALARILTAKFEKFKEHDAVKKLNFLLEQGFLDLYDVDLGLFHSPLPEFKPLLDYPEIYYENDTLTKEEVKKYFEDFNESVKDFYFESGIQTYFETEGKEIVNKLFTELEMALPQKQIISEIEKFFGLKRDKYQVSLSIFSFNGIGKARILPIGNKKVASIFITSNPLEESDTIPHNLLKNFKVGYEDPEYFQEMVIHELIHTFFNESLRENRTNKQSIESISYLFTDEMRERMKKQGYQEWSMVFEEHLVRIIETIIAENLGDSKFGKEYKNRCTKQLGFTYWEMISKYLNQYQRDRKRYRNFEKFIPDLIRKIKSEK